MANARTKSNVMSNMKNIVTIVMKNNVNNMMKSSVNNSTKVMMQQNWFEEQWCYN